MIAGGPPRRLQLRGWLPLIAAGVVLTIVLCVVAWARAEESRAAGTSDFRDYWLTANHYRDRGEITAEEGVHNYLPFFVFFMTPLSYLPLKVAVVLFTLLSMGLLTLSVVLIEILLNDGLGPRPRRATLATIGLMLAYVWSAGALGAVAMLVLFLIVATWFLIERGREWEAGLPLGLAVLIKVLPVVLIVFFLLKRRWRVAGVASAVTLVLGAGIPLAGVGYEETVRLHAEFYQRAPKGHSAYQTLTAEKPQKAKYSNNALPIVLRRLFTRVNASPGDDGAELYVNIANLPRGVVWSGYLALLVAASAISVWVALRANGRWPPEAVDQVIAVRAQFGLWCCLILLASPLLWTRYLLLLYWPLAFVADRAQRTETTRRSPHRICLLALLVWLIAVGLLAWPAARAVGAQLAAVAVLWLVLAVQLLRSGRRPDSLREPAQPP